MLKTALLVFIAFGTAAGAENNPAAASLRAISNSIASGQSSNYLRWTRLSCDPPFVVQQDTPRLDIKGDFAVLHVKSDGCSESSLIVLYWKNKAWLHLDTLVMSSKYGESPSITFPRLIRNDTSQILIQHQLTDSGTGIVQKQISIYRLVDSKLTCIFDEPEYVRYAAGDYSTEYSVLQESSFVIKDATHEDVLGNQFLHEDRKLTVNGTVVFRALNWIWDAKARHFRCFEAYPNVARD